MPIFEYACSDCGRQFETLVRSDTVPECPACHSTHLNKQLSVFATAQSNGMEPARAAGPGSPCGSCGHPDGPGACQFN
jgi:putative FmdB family regulatory protein